MPVKWYIRIKIRMKLEKWGAGKLFALSRTRYHYGKTNFQSNLYHTIKTHLFHLDLCTQFFFLLREEALVIVCMLCKWRINLFWRSYCHLEICNTMDTRTKVNLGWGLSWIYIHTKYQIPTHLLQLANFLFTCFAKWQARSGELRIS